MNKDDLKFPAGQFIKPEKITIEILSDWIEEIKSFPAKLKNEVSHLSDEQLDTPYRKDGWTGRQVIHHCADSHMNSLIRFKLALTEDRPVIKPYFEDRWAELSDSKSFPVESSVKLLEGLHERWAELLNNLSEEDLAKIFIHPELGKEIRLDENTGFYAWHCRHHLAHITSLKERKNWK
ncbi:MAG: putative metal-dependent hydrolase [Ignavibacteria bacterium]|nr:putative metal-dependent hydrolase [Ignavibacteria bacterium]